MAEITGKARHSGRACGIDLDATAGGRGKEMHQFWQDLRHGARMLAKAPGFSAVAVLSIAIGVGANAAMFSIADGLLLRPLPVPDAGGVVQLSTTTPTGTVVDNLSYPDFSDVRDQARSFAGLSATRGLVASFAVRRDDQAQTRFGVAVSANLFDVLRVRPALGRAFAADEDRVEGRDAVVILSHETWTQQFGADPAIVGRTIRLAGRDFSVIGVTPEGFTGTNIYVAPAFYIPMAMLPGLDMGAGADVLQRRDVRRLDVHGRLSPGTTEAQANEEVRLIGLALQRAYPDTNARFGLLARYEMNTRFAQSSLRAVFVMMLLGLALAVLGVACANVAGLLTSRAPVRAREMALRLAIGGSRARLIRQQVTECLLLVAAGGLLGLGVAQGVIQSFQQFQVDSDVGAKLTYVLDSRALVVGLGIAVASALLSSLIPAWRTARARDMASTLRGGRTLETRAPRLWGRHGLVASQIALTLVVLTMAVAFYRAFEREYGLGPGFKTDHLLLASLDPRLAGYDAARTESFYDLLQDRVAAIPGVTSVALTTFVPLTQDGGDSTAIVPEGYQLPPGVQRLTVAAARIDEDYLDAIGVRVTGGRGLQASDTADAPRVVVVSRGLAERYWPGQDPIGKRLRIGMGGEWAEIVGVAADYKFRLFTPTSTPFVYLPRRQHPPFPTTLVVGTAGESASAAAAVRAAISALDREMPIVAMRAMEDFYYANAKNLNVVTVRTVALLGAMGLVLALAGLYGLMAYSVSSRTREIGMRIAVGAMPTAVVRMVMRQGTVPSVVGIAIGVAASAAVGSLIQTAIPGTSGDLFTYSVVVPTVVAVVMLAAYLPARRAAEVDPLVALRQE
jgi:predicted permease